MPPSAPADGMRRLGGYFRQPLRHADVSWTIEPAGAPTAKHLTIDKLETQLRDRDATFLTQGGAGWRGRRQAGRQD